MFSELFITEGKLRLELSDVGDLASLVLQILTNTETHNVTFEYIQTHTKKHMIKYWKS